MEFFIEWYRPNMKGFFWMGHFVTFADMMNYVLIIYVKHLEITIKKQKFPEQNVKGVLK